MRFQILFKDLKDNQWGEVIDADGLFVEDGFVKFYETKPSNVTIKYDTHTVNTHRVIKAMYVQSNLIKVTPTEDYKQLGEL